MKEQTRNIEVQINEEEIGKLLEKEFRIMIVKMIINLENKMEKIQESINKDLEELMATHSSVLAWRIPGTGEPGGLPSMGSHRVGHDWSNLAAAEEELKNKHTETIYTITEIKNTQEGINSRIS